MVSVSSTRSTHPVASTTEGLSAITLASDPANSSCQPAGAALLVMVPVAAPSGTPGAANVTEVPVADRMTLLPFSPAGVAPANSAT